ncbi:unnamed protein product, partial [Choristocarpus tenellus]
KSSYPLRYFHSNSTLISTLKGLSPEETQAVKQRAEQLKVEREVTAIRLHPLLEKRNSLSYGRLFLTDSLSSFE